MTERIVDLAAERARRRRTEPPPAVAADTGEAIGLMGLATSAWLVGWVKLWTSMWAPWGTVIR